MLWCVDVCYCVVVMIVMVVKLVVECVVRGVEKMVKLDELGSFSWAQQVIKMAITPSFLGV